MKRPGGFLRDDEGALTAFSLYITVAAIIVGGLGLDLANAVTAKTRLQVAADSAAHAALVSREYKSAAEAKAIAVQVAQSIVPTASWGNAITEDDIHFGYYDTATKDFEIDDSSNKYVLVTTERAAERANPIATYFLRLLGVTNFDVVSESVFETYYPTCFREGFVAQMRVDVQSNNNYEKGFCIHSNDHVEVNNGNAFKKGVIVSMPDRRDLVMPSDGYDNNDGLEAALRDGAYHLRIINRIDDIIANVDDPDSPYFRTDYVDADPLTGDIDEVNFTWKDKIDDIWQEGAIHRATCNTANKSITLPANAHITKGVIITNCKVSLGSNSQIEDVIIVTTNTEADSINGASGVTVGKDDKCAPGGGAQLVTLGGMNFPSNLQVYGGQLVAAKTVDFAARANGIEGISIVSGEEIDGTSLMNMGFCGGLGLENNFMAEYFRLVV